MTDEINHEFGKEPPRSGAAQREARAAGKAFEKEVAEAIRAAT